MLHCLVVLAELVPVTFLLHSDFCASSDCWKIVLLEVEMQMLISICNPSAESW